MIKLPYKPPIIIREVEIRAQDLCAGSAIDIVSTAQNQDYNEIDYTWTDKNNGFAEQSYFEHNW